jgi:hypothetical protein
MDTSDHSSIWLLREAKIVFNDLYLVDWLKNFGQNFAKKYWSTSSTLVRRKIPRWMSFIPFEILGELK